MRTFFIEIGKNKLHYCQYGEGKEALLAFHGFGQDHTFFKNFAEAVRTQYTVYAFDIFFHGKSNWKNCEETLSEAEWMHFITIFLSRHHIRQFSLAGYSLGGKLALITFAHLPDKVNRLILMAPDGVKTSFWYSLATYPYWIRKAFRATITQPKCFFLLVRVFEKLHFLEKGVAKFAKSQMNSRRRRYRVYCTWMVLKKMKPDIHRTAQLINHHTTAVEMFLGKYDRIIREKNMSRLLHRLQHYQLHILNTGHNTLIEDTAKFYQHQKK